MNYTNSKMMEYTSKYGTYYNPANKHYKYKGIVNCDRCSRTNLLVCIGWEEYDLCLKCADDLSINMKKRSKKKMVKPPPLREIDTLTFMMKDQFKDFEYPHTKTRMLQTQFEDFLDIQDYKSEKYHPIIGTNMEQDQFKFL